MLTGALRVPTDLRFAVSSRPRPSRTLVNAEVEMWLTLRFLHVSLNIGDRRLDRA